MVRPKDPRLVTLGQSFLGVNSLLCAGLVIKTAVPVLDISVPVTQGAKQIRPELERGE